MSNYNQNDNNDEIVNQAKETGKKVIRKTSNGVKNMLNKGKKKILKGIGKGAANIAKGVGKAVTKAIGSLLAYLAPFLLIIVVVILIIVIFIWMFNQGMATGIMKEMGRVKSEDKEFVVIEDKYWQTTSDHSYYQEFNSFGVKQNAGDEIANWATSAAKDFTPFLNWQADNIRNANGLDDKLISANGVILLEMAKDYYDNYLD